METKVNDRVSCVAIEHTFLSAAHKLPIAAETLDRINFETICLLKRDNYLITYAGDCAHT